MSTITELILSNLWKIISITTSYRNHLINWLIEVENIRRGLRNKKTPYRIHKSSKNIHNAETGLLARNSRIKILYLAVEYLSWYGGITQVNFHSQGVNKSASCRNKALFAGNVIRYWKFLCLEEENIIRTSHQIWDLCNMRPKFKTISIRCTDTINLLSELHAMFF